MPTEFEILERLRAGYEEVIDQEVDWSPDTFEGAFSVAVARAISTNSDTLQDLWDGLSVQAASGASLEVLGAFLRVSREAATFSTVELQLSGDAATVVPDGSVVEDPSTGQRWVLTEAVVIPGTGVASPEEKGPITASAGEITRIITPIAGWDAVTNPNPARRGRRRETDADYRLRILRDGQGGSGSSRLGIQNAIRQLPFITGSLVIHNPTSSPATVQGIALPPNSIRVVVAPDTLPEEQEDQIFDTLIEFAPAGIELTGEEEDDRDGWPVKFSYAEEVEVDIDMEITLSSEPGFSTSEVVEEVETQLGRFVERGNTGEPVRILAIFGLLNTIQGVVGVDFLEINGASEDFQPAATEFTVPGIIQVSVA